MANSDNVVSTKFLFGDNLDQQRTDVAEIGQKVSSSAISRYSRMPDRSRKSNDHPGQSSKHPSFLFKGLCKLFQKKRGQTRYSRASTDLKRTR